MYAQIYKIQSILLIYEHLIDYSSFVRVLPTLLYTFLFLLGIYTVLCKIIQQSLFLVWYIRELHCISWFFTYCEQIVSMYYVILKIQWSDGFNVFYGSSNSVSSCFNVIECSS